jgi:hypothetical protein
MRIEIHLGDIRFLEADLMMAAVLEDERPPGGLTGLLDWYLCGHLSDLILEGKVRGREGELVLLATQGRISCPKFMGVGLGRSGNDSDLLPRLLPDLVERVGGLQVGTVALEILGTRGKKVPPRTAMKLILGHFKENPGGSARKLERLIVIPESETQLDQVEKVIRAGG